VTPSVKEALEALAEWEPDGDRELDAFLFVKAHLEAQAAEAACWLVIEEWQLHPMKRAQLTLGVGRFVITLVTSDAYYNAKETDCAGSTRLEALQAAAEWIKKEGSK